LLRAVRCAIWAKSAGSGPDNRIRPVVESSIALDLGSKGKRSPYARISTMHNSVCFPPSRTALHTRIATRRRELTDAYELIYRSYVAKGYISPHSGGIVYRAAFGLPCSRTIVSFDTHEQLLGTLTITGDNPLGMQLETTYPSEVQLLRGRRRRLAEITCLAIRPADEFPSMAVFFALTQFLVHYAYRRHYDDLLIAIHPRHQRFYRRCFRVELVGPCRPHGLVGGHPAICCRIDLHGLKRNGDPKLWNQYFADELPKASYFAPPIRPEDHLYFCSRRGIAPDARPDGHGGGDRRAA